jgi:hypothetical protein
MKIRLTVGGRSATATLYDNPAALDFGAMLPLSLTMEDYDTIERVSDLARKLSTRDAPDGMAPVAGELTHYAPWGNLAIFLKGRSFARNLLPLGRVDEGLSILAQPGPLPAADRATRGLICLIDNILWLPFKRGRAASAAACPA